MLTICLNCNSKLFAAGVTPPRTCEACGSRRIAIVSARALLEQRPGPPGREPRTGGDLPVTAVPERRVVSEHRVGGSG